MNGNVYLESAVQSVGCNSRIDPPPDLTAGAPHLEEVPPSLLGLTSDGLPGGVSRHPGVRSFANHHFLKKDDFKYSILVMH